MTSLLKVLGILLLIPAGLLVLATPFAVFEGRYDAVPGLIILLGLFGAPGALLLVNARKREREEELQTQMVGFVRSRDAFAITELAAHIGKTPAEAQTLLTRDIARYRLPLVVHRASGRYLRLDRLSSSALIADKCSSCGGVIDAQIVMAGEQLSCPYCGSVMQGHAPAPQQPWQPQGAWQPSQNAVGGSHGRW